MKLYAITVGYSIIAIADNKSEADKIANDNEGYNTYVYEFDSNKVYSESCLFSLDSHGNSVELKKVI